MLYFQRDRDDASIQRIVPPPNATPQQLNTRRHILERQDRNQIEGLKQRLQLVKPDTNLYNVSSCVNSRLIPIAQGETQYFFIITTI